jgi:hypothetical protein
MIYVQAGQASLRDDDALTRLLTSIPHPPAVRLLLRKSFFGRRWQQGEGCDYWLISNGETAVCMRICGATAAQVYAIRMRFDAMAARSAVIELSRDLLCKLVREVTGECRGTGEPNVRIKYRAG